MSTPLPRERHSLSKPPPASETAPRAQPQATPPANDHFLAPPHDERIDPLWMITAAGALLFVFLAIAATFS